MASVLRYADYGEPGKVLKMCSEQLSAPENDKMLVKILLAPINPADINTIQGKLSLIHRNLQLILVVITKESIR
jgi:trans-2-enoyl-CoA reductase